MLLKVQLRSLADRRVPVPWATGFQELDARADNYLYRLSLPEERAFSELIFTPFESGLWADLWYVRLVNKETKGIIARVGEFMERRRINIIGMDSNTTLHGKYHVSRIALDCRGYRTDEDGGHSQRQAHPEAVLDQLRRELVLEFIAEIKFFEPSCPCISIERNQSLWRLSKDIAEHAIRLSQQKLGLRDGCFEIPGRYIKSLGSHYARRSSTGSRSEPKALVTFDYESDLLRLIMFYDNSGIVPFTVSLENRPGAIAAVAESLSDHDFNILASKGHSIDEERILLWMLLQPVSGIVSPIDDEILAKRVSKALESSDKVRQFDPQLVRVPVFSEV